MLTLDGQYVRFPSGRLLLAGLVQLFEYVEAQGCQLSIDREGDVQVTHEDRLNDDIVYELQSSSRSVSDWLTARRGSG